MTSAVIKNRVVAITEHLLGLGFVQHNDQFYHNRINVWLDSHDGETVVFPEWEDAGEKSFPSNTDLQSCFDFIKVKIDYVKERHGQFVALCEGVLAEVKKIGILADLYRRPVPPVKYKRNRMERQRRVWRNEWNYRLRIKALDNWEPIYFSSEEMGEINMEFCDVVHYEIESVEHAMRILTNQDRDDCDVEMLRDAIFEGQFIYTEDNPNEFTAFFFKYGLISCKTNTVEASFVSDDSWANQLFASKKRTMEYHTIKLRRALDKSDRELIQALKDHTPK